MLELPEAPPLEPELVAVPFPERVLFESLVRVASLLEAPVVSSLAWVCSAAPHAHEQPTVTRTHRREWLKLRTSTTKAIGMPVGVRVIERPLQALGRAVARGVRQCASRSDCSVSLAGFA